MGSCVKRHLNRDRPARETHGVIASHSLLLAVVRDSSITQFPHFYATWFHIMGTTGGCEGRSTRSRRRRKRGQRDLGILNGCGCVPREGATPAVVTRAELYRVQTINNTNGIAASNSVEAFWRSRNFNLALHRLLRVLLISTFSNLNNRSGSVAPHTVISARHGGLSSLVREW